MNKYQLLLISQNHLFQSILKEQIGLFLEYEKLVLAENNLINLINKNHFDGFLIDTQNLAQLDFIKELSPSNQQKPFIFFADPNHKINPNDLLSGKNLRQIIYCPFKLESFFEILKANLNKYEKGIGSIIKIGEFILDQGQRQLTDQHYQIIAKLTEKEVEILRYLFKHKNQAVKKEKLLEHIWGYNPDMNTHTIETHIYRLRQKIKAMAKYLITDDQGYSLMIDHEQSSN